MGANAFSKRRRARLPRLAPVLMFRDPHQPPSSALINVILEYADIQHQCGGDRVILRLSPRRMKDPVIKEILGREAKRLADVSLLWDEEEGSIVSVMDDAAIDDAATQADQDSEFDTFELTEAALEYVARHQGRRGR